MTPQTSLPTYNNHVKLETVFQNYNETSM